MLLVMMDDVDIELMLGAQNFLRICTIPSVGCLPQPEKARHTTKVLTFLSFSTS